MNLANAHKEVKEWMTACGQETPEQCTIPYNDILRLRHDLIDEEVNGETLTYLRRLYHPNCLIEENILELIDGLGDSLFVIIGTFVALGVDTGEAHKEICKSNWTKFWTYLEARQYLTDNPESDYTFKETFKSENKEARNYLVKSSTGKVIKSPSFTPPDLTRFLPKELKEPKNS